MSPTGVKQFYTEASATVKTVTGGSTSVDGVCYLKGVTINPSGATCHVRIWQGSSTQLVLKYMNRNYRTKLSIKNM